MIPGSPMIWLTVIGLLSGPSVYGVMKIQQWKQWQAAYAEGKQAGQSASAASTVGAAVETQKATREAEAATPLPADKTAILALCKSKAGCRERGTIK